MPLSIWARVPKNTRISDSANRTTVSFSDASVSTAFITGLVLFFRGAAGGVRSAVIAPDGVAGAGCTEVSLIGASGEFHGLQERLEFRLVLRDHVGVADHLHVPRLVLVDERRQQHPLRLAGQVKVAGR